MHKLLLLLLVLISLSAQAVIYKSVDEDGNVVFEDKDSPNAEEIPVPSPNTVTLPKYVPGAAPVAPDEKSYSSLQITSPAADETIRSNPGLLSIRLALSPELDIKAGHSINILVDGYVLVKKSTQLSAQIPDISRGTHRVQVLVSNKQGATLIKSAEVQFFMQRQSLLNKPGASRHTPLDSAGAPIYPGPQGGYFRPGAVPAISAE